QHLVQLLRQRLSPRFGGHPSPSRLRTPQGILGRPQHPRAAAGSGAMGATCQNQPMTELVALGTRVPLLVEGIDEAVLQKLLTPWRDTQAPDPSMPATDPVRLGPVTAETFDADASRLA